jgi:general secretion pathway protein K
VTLTLQDEGGKVDLNAAPIELIAGLFASLGIDDAAALAQAIVDRRAAYSSNVTPVRRSAPGNFVNGFGSGNAVFDMRLLPFATVAELRLVPGMTRAAYDRVRPFVTVYSTGAKVNPLTASREVLLGVPGVSPQDVEFLIASRQAVAAGGPSENAPRLSGVDRYVGPSDLHAVTVRAFAVTDGGGNFEREAVVILTDTPLRPIQILEWRQGLDERPRFDE